ncbi:MAG: DUF58 domain-containing protein [Bacteroidia bacterium]|jgi:uncharacterized protein (DUF58 family)
MSPFFKRFDLYFQPRFYWAVAGLFALFVLSYSWPWLFIISKILLAAFAFVFFTDLLIILLPKMPITAFRHSTPKWSLGDLNRVRLHIKNSSVLNWRMHIYDALPVELQIRDFSLVSSLKAGEEKEIEYQVKPKKRGNYVFGNLHILIHGQLGLLSRRLKYPQETAVPVYPSVLQMKKYALYTASNIAQHYGVKRMRRIGHSYEFEQIKDYVRGDDLRHINWKATGRTGNLKSNHFIEEKAQPIYCILDKSRTMNLAFEGMTLLDYAINASLVISNTALQKGDKAGLITFSDKVGTALRSDNNNGQLHKIMEQLYSQKYRQSEPDFEFLFHAINTVVNQRSLLFLFTNFETPSAMAKALPVLRKINQRHLLVVVLFENTELAVVSQSDSMHTESIYTRALARQWMDNKSQMIATLQQHGIQTMLTQPANLTINSLNKYIELKAKGLI